MASVDDVQDSLDKLMRQVFESAHGHIRAVDAAAAANAIASSSSSSTLPTSNSNSHSVNNSNSNIPSNGQPDTIKSIAAERVEELKVTFEELRNQIKNLHGIDISKSQLDSKIEAINSEYRTLRAEILDIDTKLDKKTDEIDAFLEKVIYQSITQ